LRKRHDGAATAAEKPPDRAARLQKKSPDRAGEKTITSRSWHRAAADRVSQAAAAQLWGCQCYS